MKPRKYKGIVYPKRDFTQIDAVALSVIVHSDIQGLARLWGKAHPKAKRKVLIRGAIETSALYLQANHQLYIRDTIQDTRDAHQGWMLLMQEWFFGMVDEKRVLV